MSGQHFYNAIPTLVQEAIEGHLISTPSLKRLDGFPNTKVVYNPKHDGDAHVAVLSGGGAGHEPAMVGYVGDGMLAAAVSGDIFASPSEDAVLAGIRAIAGRAGVLIIVMNYTGDRLNFGAAAERAKAEGIAVEMVIVADDVAPIEGGTVKNRRGIAGTVLVHKVAGAFAAAGEPLERVTEAARAAASSISSVGCSLSVCTVPGAPPSDRIKPGEMEMGLGIHGEPGAYKTATTDLDDVVAKLLACIHDAQPLVNGSSVALMVNNLGGTTPLELGAATASAARQLRDFYGVSVDRVLAGLFMSSLAMHGLSVSVLRLGQHEGLVGALDAPTATQAWPRELGGPWRGDRRATPVPIGSTDGSVRGGTDSFPADPRVVDALRAASAALQSARERLDDLDGRVGDGDCGSTVARGAAAAYAAAQEGRFVSDPGDLGATAMAIGRVLGAAMGGTSGAIYKLIFTAAGAELQRRGSSGAQLDVRDIGAALDAGAAAASKYGGAEEHDRTMLAALWPAARVLAGADPAACAGALRSAAAAARAAAEATAESSHAGAGRSAYVRGDILKGVPDPGAVGVSVWLEALVPVFSK